MTQRKINIILCEGDTDRDLLGYYIMRVTNWRYKNNLKDPPFNLDEKASYIAWYKDKDDEDNILGIWPIGGNNFIPAIDKISKRLKFEGDVNKLVIITDHDDKAAETDRKEEIYSEFTEKLGSGVSKNDDTVSGWTEFSFNGGLGPSKINVYYLLVPIEENGALETFMMNALAENDDDKAALIAEAKSFVQKVSKIAGEKYLKGRRDKIKAELGAAISVLSPDKVFSTMNELISSVQWENFDNSHKQFQVLKEI